MHARPSSLPIRELSPARTRGRRSLASWMPPPRGRPMRQSNPKPSSAPARPGSRHDGRRLGEGVHRTAAAVLDGGNRTPTVSDILEAVARDPALVQPNLVYRLAARQVLASATAIYFRLVLPATDWQFLGSEMVIPGGSLDLVFESVAGEVLADEIKSGRTPDLVDKPALDKQIERELAGGLERFGVLFVGVRVLFLGAPSKSFIARADGTRDPLDRSLT
jgi:hypothetical protein